MTNEAVKYAPKAVIDELDNNAKDYIPFGLLEVIIKPEFDNMVNTRNWYKRMRESDINESILKTQMAIINHVFGNERLQPEREPRYYVEFVDDMGNNIQILSSNYLKVSICYSDSTPNYEEGLNHGTAVKAQALYGGTIEEIK